MKKEVDKNDGTVIETYAAITITIYIKIKISVEAGTSMKGNGITRAKHAITI